MKNKNLKKRFYFVASQLTLIFAFAVSISAQTTIFTYQGKLTDAGSPANGSYQLQFKLFDAGGTQIGSTISNVAVTISQGVFTTQLDFGASAFPGADRFLEIAVKKNAGDPYTVLNPRQQIASSPYSIRTLSAAQADVALDSQKLGGVAASEYVTTTSVGNSFIKNATTPQTANFNISGNGVVGGTLGVGGTPQAGVNLDVTGTSAFRTGNGVVNFGSPSGETGMSVISTNNRADVRFDGSTLKLLAGSGVGAPSSTSGININRLGDVGIGTTAPTSRLEIIGQNGLAITGFQPFMTFRDTNNANLQSRLQANDGGFSFFSNNFIGGTPTLALRNSGNVGIGTTGPPTRLAISGGPAWTSNLWTGSLSMGNASAIGWEANASGQRFGIGQSTGGLYFFRTNSPFGTTDSPANYDMGITDAGNILQARDKGGLVKAMIYVNANGTVIRCYNGITGASTGNCGFSVYGGTFSGLYVVDFGFQVDDRFLSVTAQQTANRSSGVNIGTGYRFISGSPNRVEVSTFITDAAFDDSRADNTTNPVVSIGDAGGTRSCNTTTSPGQIFCSVGNFQFDRTGDSAIGEIAAGAGRTLVSIHFNVSPTAQANSSTAVRLTGVNASADTPLQVAIASQDGAVSIASVPAASVSVSGRVITAQGRGIKNAVVLLTDSSGNIRTAVTAPFGIYIFANVAAGEKYTITVRAKRFAFSQSTQVLNVNNDTENIDFIGTPTNRL